MAFGMKIEGSDAIKLRLQALAKKYGKSYRVSVGFSAEYSVYVHERLDVYHPRGQAKFLEQPAREHRQRMGRIVGAAVRRGRSVRDGLQEAGDFLLREARALVPYDTGHLYRSGFVRVYSTGG
jgi:hypothetical protein